MTLTAYRDIPCLDKPQHSLCIGRNRLLGGVRSIVRLITDACLRPSVLDVLSYQSDLWIFQGWKASCSEKTVIHTVRRIPRYPQTSNSYVLASIIHRPRGLPGTTSSKYLNGCKVRYVVENQVLWFAPRLLFQHCA